MEASPKGDIILTPDEKSKLELWAGHDSHGIRSDEVIGVLHRLYGAIQAAEQQWMGDRDPVHAENSRTIEAFQQRLMQVAGVTVTWAE